MPGAPPATAHRPVAPAVIFAVVAILLLAVNLRTGVGGLSPLASAIGRDITLSAASLGALGIPAPLGFALAGVVAPSAAHRFGLERTLVGALVAMIAGHLVRAAAPDVGVLLLGSLIVLMGAGFGNILLPSAVKRYAPHRIAALTAAYGTAMSVGAALPPLVAVPIAAGSDWRASLAVWSLVAVAALVPWVVLAVRARRASAPNGADAPRAPDARGAIALARSRTVWGITIGFGLSSVSAYALFALLPEVLRESAGVAAASAGALVALFGILGLPLALTVPGLTSRLRNPTPLLVTATALFTAGWGGLWLAPSFAPVAWVAAIGLGQIAFPMGLTLIGLRSRTDRTAAAVSGFVQTVGYVAAAAVPPVLGVLRDQTGSWSASMGFMTLLTAATATAIPLLRRARYIDDEIAR
ncbi:MAG: MFS transporter [Microcella sp.]